MEYLAQLREGMIAFLQPSRPLPQKSGTLSDATPVEYDKAIWHGEKLAFEQRFTPAKDPARLVYL